MPDLTLWKNRQLHRMKREIDQMFGELYRQFGGPDSAGRQEPFFPEMIETAEELTVVFDLAGMNPDDIEIMADENSLRLLVSADEQILDHGRQVNGHKSFSGNLQLPCRIMPEKATALIENNILRITLPKYRPGGLQKITVRHI